MFRHTVLRIAAAGSLAFVTSGRTDYGVAARRPGNYVEQIAVEGRMREYRIHIPVRYTNARALPLVFVFHGSSASASVIERETSLDVRADSLGFIVVYPEGIRRAWNIGECCNYSYTHHVSEVAFVVAMLERLTTVLAIDTTRVYTTGYSDGATLSYELVCTLPHRFAAVAGISGTLFKPQPACPLPSPVPVMIVHGTGDGRIPYNGQAGGPPERDGAHFTYGAADVTAFWVAKNRCVTSPVTAQYGNVIRKGYSCGDGAEVVFYTILGGSHGWPGGGRGWVFSPRPPKDMTASDSVMKFFLQRHL